MRAFIKNNSKLITKMIVLQIGIMFLGYLLFMASSVSGNSAIMLGLGIFSALFYLFLLYVHVWEIASHDKIRIDGKRMKYDPLKGFKTSLVANSLNILLAVLAAVGYLCIDRGILNENGQFISPTWACNLYSISQLLGQFFLSMYTGIGDYIGIAIKPYFLFIAIIPGLAVSTLAYIFGVKEKFALVSNSPKH